MSAQAAKLFNLFRALFRVCCAHFLFVVVIVGGQPICAQTNTKSPIQDETNLLDGVLDLVKEPVSESGGAQDEIPVLTPEDVGLRGETLGEQSMDPLQAVRQSMLIAAGFMQRGASGKQTQQLQADIVTRLDELIEQMEGKQEQQQSTSQDQREREQREQEQTQSEAENAAQAQEQRGEPEEGESQPADERQIQSTDSGNTGEQADTEVKLASPRDLQMDVWGMLPENVRAQMQTQMVEQFLPSHRKKIEAYFRALLRQGK